MWTGLGGLFIRDREPVIWAHPVVFSGSDLALTAPEIMPSSRHPSDRSFKGRGQVPRPCSFTDRGRDAAYGISQNPRGNPRGFVGWATPSRALQFAAFA